MSNFARITKHPTTGKFELASWLDNYFGPHKYGVHFPSDDFTYKESDFKWEFQDQETQAKPLGEPADAVLNNLMQVLQDIDYVITKDDAHLILKDIKRYANTLVITELVELREIATTHKELAWGIELDSRITKYRSGNNVK